MHQSKKIPPPPPPPQTRAIAGNCENLNLFSLDFDLLAGRECAKIRDLRLRDRGVSGDFTAVLTIVSHSLTLVVGWPYRSRKCRQLYFNDALV